MNRYVLIIASFLLIGDELIQLKKQQQANV